MNDLHKELSDLRSYVEFLKADRLASKKKEDGERWTRWVSLTIVFLAVAAALANQQYGGFSGRAVRSLSHAAIAQGNATNKWSYFQSVSIKLHMYQFDQRREKEDSKARKAMLAASAGAAVAEKPKEGKVEGAGKPEAPKPSGEPAAAKPEKATKKGKGDKLGKDTKSRTEEKIAKYKEQKPKIQAAAQEFEAQVAAHSKDSQAAQSHTAGLTLALAVLQVAIAVGSISALAKKKPLWFVSMAIGAYGVFETFNGMFLWV